MKASYGDVVAEYRAIREEAAVVEGTHELVWVEGPDAVSFLQGLLSQDIERMEPGTVARSLLLAPQGKLRALLWILRGEERVGLLTDAGFRDRVVDDLTSYRIRVKAEIRHDFRPVWGLWGPSSPHIAGVTAGRWLERDAETVAGVALPGLDRVLTAGGSPVSGVRRAGAVAVTAARVEAGEPVMDVDVDESTIPQETGLVPEAVSFDKGCFLGQELVARIDSRGRVNRHLRGVAVTRNVVPPAGASLLAGDREVGTLTSVSESMGVGAPVGLSLVRREVEPGDTVTVRWEGGEAPAIVRSLPMLSSP